MVLAIYSRHFCLVMGKKCHFRQNELLYWNLVGYNRDGLNRQGFDREGYNRYGYNISGYSRYGYDNEGWSKENEQDLSRRYDAYGFDMNCLDRRGKRCFSRDQNSCFVLMTSRDIGRLKDILGENSWWLMRPIPYMIDGSSHYHLSLDLIWLRWCWKDSKKNKKKQKIKKTLNYSVSLLGNIILKQFCLTSETVFF